MNLNRISEAVESLREDYVEHGFAQSYYEINNGQCEDFAMDLLKKLRSITTDVHELFNGSFMTGDGWDWKLLKDAWGIEPPAGLSADEVDQFNFGGHVWVEVGGLHFDAEAPEGVASFFELPIFKRAVVKALRMKGVSAADVVTTDVVPAPLCAVPNPS